MLGTRERRGGALTDLYAELRTMWALRGSS